jgi:sRNA-binding regulator protein Hfq
MPPYNSLRPIRERKGMTLAQLAGKTSISIRTLQLYEAGERAISSDDLRKLSRVLFASTAEILEPTVPPPAPEPPPAPPPVVAPPRPPSSVATSVASSVTPLPTVQPPPSSAEPIRRPPPYAPRGEFRRPPGNGPPARPAPRPPRAPRPPAPATEGQIDQIRNLARRMGLDEEAVVERVGAPLASLDHLGARNAIAKLRKEMEDAGTWQPRVGEGVDQEGQYLAKLRDLKARLVVRLISGEQVEGVVEDYTPYVVRLRDDSGADLTVRKLAIAYYQTTRPVDDSQ